MNEEGRIDYGYLSINHAGEELCGDHVQVARGDDGSLTLVLADGIGSGVVASILSTLTSAMLSRMVQGGIPLEECVSSLIETLPLARDRGNVAYCTFTICKIDRDYLTTIYNFDNPDPVFIKNGQIMDLHYKEMELSGKRIHKAVTYLEVGDQLSMFSDGAVYAGNEKTLNFLWDRDAIAAYLKANYSKWISAKSVATILIDHCASLYDGKPGDDTTCLTVKRREPYQANILFGPPTKKEDDEAVIGGFLELPGFHIVSGGTTCQVVANHLHSEIKGGYESGDPDIPPISDIKGVDLATEGIVTLSKVLAYANDYIGSAHEYASWNLKDDGASLIAKILFDNATDIVFYVGYAVNPAHQDEEFGFGFKRKMKIVDELASALKKMGKVVTLKYF